MKKLFLVLGNCSSIHPSITDKFKSISEECAGIIIHTDRLGYPGILKRVLETIQADDRTGYDDRMVVLYVGRNTEGLMNDLPCDSLDLISFWHNLRATVGKRDTPRQQELIRRLLFGGIKALVKK